MSAAYFITGTDTDVGKTTVAAGLLHAARQLGKSTAAGKPVASGCQVTPKGLRNADALALLAECSLPLSYAEVNPVAFEPAIAPHLAAREAGVALTVQSLLKPMQQILARQADFTLIEGAGGWRVPLADQDNLSDLAMALKLPVILVVGVRLGCISHALLTAEAIARDGLPLAGWVANIIDPKTSRLEENLATLAERLPAPCLGRVPKLKHASAEAVAQHLQLDLLDCFWLSTRHYAISVFDGRFARFSASINIHDSLKAGLSHGNLWKQRVLFGPEQYSDRAEPCRPGRRKNCQRRDYPTVGCADRSSSRQRPGPAFQLGQQYGRNGRRQVSSGAGRQSRQGFG